MALDQRKYARKHTDILRDIRPLSMRFADGLRKPSYGITIFVTTGASFYLHPWPAAFADLIIFILFLYFWWLTKQDRTIAFKLPKGAKYTDKNNEGPGKDGTADGILYLGNTRKTNEEMWFSNSDARTHILYLGTTGSGKTEGLKSIVTNAMTWGSGFVYVDGKADTDLWSSLSSLVRRFGRDDDLMVLNYMTGNSDASAPSHTMNPFSSGSASYLTNMLVSLMPEAQGDNAMWSERAISLVSAMMPVMTYKRDKQDVPLSVRTIRDNLSLNNVVKLARDETVPAEIRGGMKGYLDTLPGYDENAFDENGQIKAPDGGGPPPDTTTASQQHGYLAMQFTRSLQSLGDDYGYIFDTQAADVDMVDIVLNRRILVVLIPALEKSSEEIANLGKIVAATMKGMMGSTLGATVEGSSETVIENKPTHAATPFMTVFDEVGYYTAKGMAVMAAQARSLGFSLVFSGQDLPAMKKLVREEANSITANCNIKIFGKLEDPTETKEFFEKTVGTDYVVEVSGYQGSDSSTGSYFDGKQASVQARAPASYEELRSFKEGESITTFGPTVFDCAMFYSNPGHAKAMRVTRFMALPPPDENMIKHSQSITRLRDLMINKTWTAARADVDVETPAEFDAMLKGIKTIPKEGLDTVAAGIAAVVNVHALTNDISAEAAIAPTASPVAKPVTPPKTETPEPAKTTEPKTEEKPQKQDENASSDAPMSFFGKGDDQPDAKTSEPPQQEQKPAAKAPVKTKTELPKEIKDIIEAAAHETNKALFKKDTEKNKEE